MVASKNIPRDVFYKFLELYEHDQLDVTNYEQFKKTPLFLYIYPYVLAKKSLEIVIEKYLEEEDKNDQ